MIEINLYASLAAFLPRAERVTAGPMLDVDEGTTILELLRRFQVPMEQVKMIFLNGVHATGEEVLHERDRVGVFPAVAGG